MHILTWWIIEFVISGVIWLVLAPSFAAVVFSQPLDIGKDSQQNLSAHSLRFILGFSSVFFIASFLLPFHKAGLVILVLGLGILGIKNKITFFKFHWSDVIVVGPILFALYVLPVAIDSNNNAYQFSIFHDFWPLDWRNRIDTHFSMSGLFHYWQPSVPVMNTLAVQGVFLALLFWRILVFSYSVSLKRKAQVVDWCLLVVLYLGSLFYRKEINVKASPVGGIFVFLFVVLLGLPDLAIGDAALGWIMACPLIFGEYGLLILLPIVLIILLSNHPARSKIIRSAPYAVLFMIPELARKVFIVSEGHLAPCLAMILSCGLLIWVLRKYGTLLLGKWAGFARLDEIVAALMVFLCVCTLFFPAREGYNGGMGFSFYQWSIGREGILFPLVCYCLWKNRRTPLSRVFIIYLSVQLMMFLSQQKHFGIDLLTRLDPNMIWMNLHKNSIAIAMPLLTTVVGALMIGEWINSQSSSRIRKAIALAVLGFFVFLQDPLVKSYGDGPLSPYSPRMSALRSVSEAVWPAYSAKEVFSKSGDVILWPALSLHEPDIVESIYRLQQDSHRRLRICLDHDYLTTLQMIDFDLESYTISFPTGAIGDVKSFEHCDLKVLEKPKVCAADNHEISIGETSILCSQNSL